MGTANLIDGVEFYNNAGYGIHMWSGYPNAKNDNSIIRNSIVHDNGTDAGVTPAAGGIMAARGSNLSVYNNIAYNHPLGDGIDVGYTCVDCKTYNNTAYNNAGVGIAVGTADTTGTIVRNNISYNNGVDIRDTGTNTTFANNLCGNAGTGCTMVGDPLFVNAGAADFRLQTTSPAIDAGMTINAVTVDLQGVPRPQGPRYDIGAYEYSGLQLPTPKNLRATSVAP
jgi:hypothetical protein